MLVLEELYMYSLTPCTGCIKRLPVSEGLYVLRRNYFDIDRADWCGLWHSSRLNIRIPQENGLWVYLVHLNGSSNTQMAMWCWPLCIVDSVLPSALI